MFIITEFKFLLFDFKSLKLIEIVITYLNPRGIFGLSSNIYTNTVAYPFGKLGQIATKSYEDKEPLVKILAFDSALSFISINTMGTYLATSSLAGTIIRV